MAIIRPASDVAAGGWVTDGGSSSGLAARLSEVTPDDASAIFSPVSPGGFACVISLANLTVDPPSGACTLRYHYGKDAAGGERIDVRVELLDLDGSTVLQTWNHADVGLAPQSAQQTFTANLAPGTYNVRMTAWAVRTGDIAIPLPAPAVAGTGTAPGGVPTGYRISSSSFSPAAGSAVTITAQLIDASGTAVSQAGNVVTWSKSGGGSFSAGTSTTNASGVATVSLTCPTTVGTLTVTGTDAGGLTGTSGTITVVAAALSVPNSTVTASPASLPADGTSTATITLQARDQYGNNRTTSGGVWAPVASSGTLGVVTDWGDGHQTVVYTAGSSIVTAQITGTLAGQSLPALSIPLTDPGAVSFTASATANATQGAVSLAYSVTAGPTVTLATLRADLYDASGIKVIPGASALPFAGTVGLGWRLKGGAYTAILTATDSTGISYTRSLAPVTITDPTSRAITLTTGTPDITIDTTQKFQTWRGFEAVVQIGFDMTPTYSTWSPLVKDQLFQACLDAGIGRLRIEFNGGSKVSGGVTSYNSVIPGTPNTYDWTDFDQKMTEVVLPMRAAYLAAGRDLPYVINYVDYSRQAPSPIGTDATKYANMVLAVYQHILGLDGGIAQGKSWPLPQAWQVWNEPDNTTPVTAGGGALLGTMMATTASLFQAQTPALAVPSFIFSGFFNASLISTWWGALTAAQKALVKELSVHRYLPSDSTPITAQPNYTTALDSLGTLSASTGLPTSQNEANEPSGGDAKPIPLSVWLDLTHGNVSAWTLYSLAYGQTDNGGSSFLYDLTSTTAPVIKTGARTHLLRQVFRYVKPGAVRVAATSGNTAIRPHAWLNPDGTLAVIAEHTTNGQFTVGLVPGTYSGEYGIGVSFGTVAATPDGLFSSVTVPSGQIAAVNVPASAGFDNVATLVQAPAWPNNEPAGLTPLFHQLGNKQTTDLFGQVAQNIGANWNVASPLSGLPYVEQVRDPAAPFGTSSEHRWIYDNNNGDAEGVHQTAVDWSAWGGAFAAGITKQYVRFVVMMSPNWVGHSGGDKLSYLFMGVAGANGPQQHWLVFRSTAPGGSTAPYYRASSPPAQLTLSTQGGSNVFPTAKTMAVGVYHTIETYSVSASAPGVSDGSFIMWVDGTLVAAVGPAAGTQVGSLSPATGGINWSNFFTKFSGFHWDPYWGGNTTPPSFKHQVGAGFGLGSYDFLRFGEIYVSGAL